MEGKGRKGGKFGRRSSRAVSWRTGSVIEFGFPGKGV